MSTKRKKIALILPMRFAVRALIQTGVVSTLNEQADILLISPFAENASFIKQHSGNGIEHTTLRDYLPSARYVKWDSLFQKTIKKKWGLEAPRIYSEIYANQNPERAALESRSLIRRVMRSVYYSPVVATNSWGLRYLRSRVHAAYDADVNDGYYHEMLNREKLDLIVSTSPNRNQEFPIACAARNLGIPHITYVLSFDNICCYGEFPVVYDRYMVWNDRNRREILHQYPSVKPEDIFVSGPLQFDVYKKRDRYLVSRASWAKDVGLDETRSVILYAETGHFIAPHEPDVVADLAERIRAMDMLSRPTILVRTHPMYGLERWADLRTRYPEVVFSVTNQQRGEETTLSYEDNVNWDTEDLSLMINTLYHSNVHWNISSTMALDGAYFDKPIVCVAYDPRPLAPFDLICKRLYEREHYLDIVSSGGVVVANDSTEAWRATVRYLKEPGLHREERRKMLELYDPFLDGRSSERVSQTILAYLAEVTGYGV